MMTRATSHRGEILSSVARGTVFLVLAFLFPQTLPAQEEPRSGVEGDRVSEGAQLFSRNCQRCHQPRGPAERSDREWVIIMQHMETRANLTRDRAEMVRAFLLASNEAARRPGRQRGPLAAAPVAGDVTIEMIEDGRKIFQGPGACTSCHGADLGKGPVAPSLKDDRWRNGDGSLADILETVRNGVAGTAMAAYPAGISDEMATKVAAYVWAVSRGKAEP